MTHPHTAIRSAAQLFDDCEVVAENLRTDIADERTRHHSTLSLRLDTMEFIAELLEQAAALRSTPSETREPDGWMTEDARKRFNEGASGIIHRRKMEEEGDTIAVYFDSPPAAEAHPDTKRLDALEAEIEQQGAIILHNGIDKMARASGIGIKNTGRTLRQALDDATRGALSTDTRANENSGNNG